MENHDETRKKSYLSLPKLMLVPNNQKRSSSSWLGHKSPSKASESPPSLRSRVQIPATAPTDHTHHCFGTGPIFGFNFSVLELESIEEGPFLKQFPTPPYTSENCTGFIAFIESGGGWVMGIWLRSVWDPSDGFNTVFPEGNGTLATLTFKAKVQGTATISFEGLLGGNISAPTEVSYDLNASTVLQLLKETGMRIGEALRLDWNDVDFEKRTIVLNNPEKHGNPRMFKISEKLMAMLNRLPKDNDKVFGGSS